MNHIHHITIPNAMLHIWKPRFLIEKCSPPFLTNSHIRTLGPATTISGNNMDNVDTLPMPDFETGGLLGTAIPADVEEDVGGSGDQGEDVTPTEPEASPAETVLDTPAPKVSGEEVKSEQGQVVEQPTEEVEDKQEQKEKQSIRANSQQSTGHKGSFKRSMSVGQLMEKTREFGSVPTGLVQVPIVGTNSSNKAKVAMTEVALTRREKRRQTAQARKEDEGQPATWDSNATIAPDVQCPPKKRGRKPKDRKVEEGQDKPTRAKKGPAKPKAKAKSKNAGPKAKSKAAARKENKKATTGATPSSGSAADSRKAEQKKAYSRKSAAYHRAFKKAQQDGLTVDECKAAAKKVF